MITGNVNGNSGRILLIEDDPQLQVVLSLALEDEFGEKPLVADNHESALSLISAHPNLRCIVSDYRLKKGTGADVRRGLSDEAAKLPFILISSDDPRLLPEFRERPPTAYFAKPFEMSALLDQLRKHVGARVSQDGLPAFCQVDLQLLKHLAPLPCDFYLRLANQKRVKVLEGGAGFTSQDEQRLRSKGLQSLDIAREDYQYLMPQLSQFLLQQAKSEVVGYDAAYFISYTTLQAIQEITLAFGFRPEARQLTVSATSFALNLIRRNPSLLRLLLDTRASGENYVLDHSILLAHVASGIAAMQPWLSRVTFQQLTVAAFLHDICIGDSKVAKIQTLDEYARARKELAPEEADLVLRHPTEAAQLARQISDIPPDVDTLIAQHHEHPDGQGFPHGLDATKIRPISATFIIAHDLVHQLQAGEVKRDLPELLLKLSFKYRKGHFAAVMDSLTRAMQNSPLYLE